MLTEQSPTASPPLRLIVPAAWKDQDVSTQEEQGKSWSPTVDRLGAAMVVQRSRLDRLLTVIS